MSKVSIFVIAIVVVILAGYWFARADRTLAYTREDLQRELDRKFPAEQRALVASIRYSNPSVQINSQRARLGLSLQVTAQIADHKLIQGMVGGSGQPRFEEKRGELFLDNPELDQFDFGDISPSTRDLFTSIAEPVIRQYFRQVPLYRLKESDLKGRTVHSVSIQDGKLIVVLRAL